MAAPNQADAPSSSGHRSPSPGSSMSGSSMGTLVGDGGAPYPEGRILETPNLRIFTFAELRAATRNFKPDTLLGEGGFGRVYKGWVDEKTMSPVRSGTGMVVAVKKLKQEGIQGMQEWQVRTRSWSHPAANYTSNPEPARQDSDPRLPFRFPIAVGRAGQPAPNNALAVRFGNRRFLSQPQRALLSVVE